MKCVSVCVCVLLSVWAKGQTSKSFETESKNLRTTLLQQHVAPRAIDDKFSAWVFDDLINELDPDRLFFTNEDVNALINFRLRVDDELTSASWTFLPAITTLYKTSLQRYRSGISELAARPVDFLSSESIPDDSLWSDHIVDIQKRWRVEFQANTFERLVDLRKKFNVTDDKKLIAQYEKPAREQVQKVMLHKADRILNHRQGFETYVASAFNRSIAVAFDPHTIYYSPAEVEKLMSSLSSKGFYYGFTLGENEKGDVIVTQLVPGGPAWKSGQINTGDVWMELQFNGEPAIDLWGYDASEVSDLMEESTQSSIVITVRKPDGTTKIVSLFKEKMDSEDDVVKSFLLSGEKKIGYISLPDFYSDWGSDDEGSRCANDVAREIIKLKTQNIDGLILDLRSNGGGILSEAVAMAGIFIDAGPVSMVKTRDAEPITIKDMNRGTIYDGPLIVMVNQLSASASEVLAGALQDYNRAVIVGGITYGKATGQQILPIAATTEAKEKKSLRDAMEFQTGFAAITMEKLYRVTGKTNQFYGVKPDIFVPDVFQKLSIGEKYLKLAIMPDSLARKTYYRPLPELPLASLAQKSRVRVDALPQFKAVGDYGLQLGAFTDDASPVISWTTFKSDVEKADAIMSGLETNLAVPTTAFVVSKLASDEQRMSVDNYINEFNQHWIKKLQSDILLNEAFHITNDLITLQTTK